MSETGAATIAALDFDPFSKAYFDDPYPDQQALREAGPVARLTQYGIWAVARHAEVTRVLSEWQTFCSGRGVGLADFATEAPWRPQSLVLEADPPAHTRARTVLARVLSPATMKRLRADFEQAADTLAAELAAKASVDGIADIAEAFPLSVFPAAMGMDQTCRPHLLPYGNLAFNAFGPRNALLEAASKAAAPALAWLPGQMQRASFAEGGIGAAIHACADTGEITPDEAAMLARSLLTAGVDTTVNGIGAALYSFARFPAQWARLRAEPDLARNAFEEAVRLESPVQTFFRTTTGETEIAGVRIGEGEKILAFLGAANRDPRRWENPDDFDIARRTQGHVGFGAGIHMCVGQLLARLEGETLLRALARHVTAIEVAGPIRRRYNNTLRGLASLPLTLHS